MIGSLDHRETGGPVSRCIIAQYHPQRRDLAPSNIPIYRLSSVPRNLIDEHAATVLYADGGRMDLLHLWWVSRYLRPTCHLGEKRRKRMGEQEISGVPGCVQRGGTCSRGHETFLP